MSLFGDETINSTTAKKNNKAIAVPSVDKTDKNNDVKTIKSVSKKPKIRELIEERDNKPMKDIKEIQSFKQLEDILLNNFLNNTLHHAIMFSGNYGIGKATFAYWLISRMIIAKDPNRSNMHLQLLQAGSHPDVFLLELEEGENEIKIDQIRKFLEKISFKATYGYKFAIIDDISSINLNGVNALLKTLEEPPENTYFFIINHKTSKVLDTIYSRCNEIKMHFSNNDCINVLQKIYRKDIDDAKFYADIAGNSVSFAKILADMNVKKMIENCNNQDAKLDFPELLNNINRQIELNCKAMSRILKISLLERVLMYLINTNVIIPSGNVCINRKNILVINSLTKQFVDIKRFELPVKFI